MGQLMLLLAVVTLGHDIYSSIGADASNGITTCYDGWLPFKGSCYYFGHDGLTFTSAENYCRQRHNSHLIHVDDRIENEFIKDQLRTSYRARYWWMGLTDEDTESVWKWFDSGEITSFLDWAPGQPNHHADDCAGFAPDLDYRWIDTSCTLHHYPICEIGDLGEHEIIGK